MPIPFLLLFEPLPLMLHKHDNSPQSFLLIFHLLNQILQFSLFIRPFLSLIFAHHLPISQQFNPLQIRSIFSSHTRNQSRSIKYTNDVIFLSDIFFASGTSIASCRIQLYFDTVFMETVPAG